MVLLCLLHCREDGDVDQVGAWAEEVLGGEAVGPAEEA